MGRKTPPFKYYPEWTEARFWSFLRSGLRRMHMRWPAMYMAKNKARRPFKGGGRTKWEYGCNRCKGYFKDKEIEIHHKEDVGTLGCYNDLPGFVERLFCGEEGYEVLCKECHLKEKS